MNVRTPAEASELAHSVAEEVSAEQAECVVVGTNSSLTRFARNRIHQNVTEIDVRITVRAVNDGRTGVASTNRLDADSIRRCSDAAVQASRVAPRDPDFPGLPANGDTEPPDRRSAATIAFGPEERAGAVGAIVAQSSSRGFEAAGRVEVSDTFVAIANSFGTAAAMSVADAAASVLASGPGGGSGWASWTGADAADFDPDVLGSRAADLAARSADAGDLPPGSYTVVLAHDAVATLLEYLSYAAFSAKAVHEKTSFMAGAIGESMFPEAVSITDDASRRDSLGLAFDWEGVPKRRTPIIERGRVVGPVTDSYWAAKTGARNTAHALPAPNTFGPLPLDLEIAPGEATLDGMIGSVQRGLYITRFHYVNVEEPSKVVLTGMTRDGTFLIEDGRLASPVRNLRFTHSALDVLRGIRAIEGSRVLVRADIGAHLVPALLVDGFAVTGQTG